LLSIHHLYLLACFVHCSSELKYWCRWDSCQVLLVTKCQVCMEMIYTGSRIYGGAFIRKLPCPNFL
jgi:hypothetical protein